MSLRFKKEHRKLLGVSDSGRTKRLEEGMCEEGKCTDEVGVVGQMRILGRSDKVGRRKRERQTESSFRNSDKESRPTTVKTSVPVTVVRF